MDFIHLLTINSLLVAIRLFGMIMVTPFFNSVTIPAKVKLIFVLLLTFIITPQVSVSSHTDVFGIQTYLQVLTQFAIGASMGFILQLAMQIVTAAGQILAIQCGLGYATLMDPNTNDTLPIISQFYFMLALFIFVEVDGHLALISMLFTSFKVFPLDSAFPVHNIEKMILMGGQIFSGGVTIALSGIISLLIINLTFSVMSRSAPQLNIMSIGFILILLLGLTVIAINIPSIINHSMDIVDNGLSFVRDFMEN
jgi:flagellar biosynthetic protein FliR